MKRIWIYLFFIFIGFGEIKTNLITKYNVENEKEVSHIDVLITELKREKWLQDEKPCFDIMLLTLESAKNSTLWAVWMLDSMQPPTGLLYGVKLHLGNYDECLNPGVGFKIDRPELLPQYCVADVRLIDHTVRRTSHAEYNASLHTYLKTNTKHGLDLSYLSWGACLPRVCKQNTIPKILRVFLKNSHLGSLSDKANITIESCQVTPPQHSRGFYLFILIVSLLAVTTVWCTYFVNATNSEVVSDSFVRELARSFCLKRNMESLTKVRNDEIISINIMRPLTCFIILLSHLVCAILKHTVVDMLSSENMVIGPMMQLPDFLVSTFFTISGLLFTRGFLNDKIRNPFMYIWKRYIRLVAALAAVQFFTTMVSCELADGPVWSKYCVKEKEICENNVWFNALMLGNYDCYRICMPVSWYVACDFQLCVLATFIFYIYNKNKKYGIYTFLVMLVIGAAIPGLLTYWNKYPTVMLDEGLEPIAITSLLSNVMERVINTRLPAYLKDHDLLSDRQYGFRHDRSTGDLLVNTIFIVENNVVLQKIYAPGHNRIASFMIGMAMGYILYTYKPSNYRNVISNTRSYAGVVAALYTMWSINILAIRYYGEHNPIEGAIYVSINKVIWTIGVCIIIGISEYGMLPILNKVFAWYPLYVLSRLSYGVYLVHIIFIQHTIFSLRDIYTVYLLNTIITAVGIFICSLFVSLLLLLLVEAPLANINNVLIKRMSMTVTMANRNGRCIQEEKKQG